MCMCACTFVRIYIHTYIYICTYYVCMYIYTYERNIQARMYFLRHHSHIHTSQYAYLCVCDFSCSTFSSSCVLFCWLGFDCCSLLSNETLRRNPIRPLTCAYVFFVCLYMYVCICGFLCILHNKNVYVCIYMRVCARMHVWVFVHTTQLFICIYICVICVYTCVCMYGYLCILSIYIYIYIYIYIHVNKTCIHICTPYSCDDIHRALKRTYVHTHIHVCIKFPTSIENIHY